MQDGVEAGLCYIDDGDSDRGDRVTEAMTIDAMYLLPCLSHFWYVLKDHPNVQLTHTRGYEGLCVGINSNGTYYQNAKYTLLIFDMRLPENVTKSKLRVLFF